MSAFLPRQAGIRRNRFTDVGVPDIERLPLSDEPFVATWEQYAAEAREAGVYEVFKRCLVQLSFPVRAGISATDHYRAVTLRGQEEPSRLSDSGGSGLILCSPGQLELTLQQTPAGRIPVIVTPDRQDFVTLVQALSLRNEPVSVPESMGGCTIQGYNNWHRIRQYRERWQQGNPSADWTCEFAGFRERKELYQDCFILLCRGPYSAVKAEHVGLDCETWLEKSLLIRLHHECTHYLTRRLLGSMQNNLLDELLADYAGIVAAFGSFRADLFMRCMGLENFPHYRQGGRMENYRGKPPLSGEAFKMLQSMVVDAARNLELFDRAHYSAESEAVDRTRVILALSKMSLREIAFRNADDFVF